MPGEDTTKMNGHLQEEPNGSASLPESWKHLVLKIWSLDVDSLDYYVDYCGLTGEELAKQEVQEELRGMALKALPDPKSNNIQRHWVQVARILKDSKYQGSKYYGLLILEDVIKSKWQKLPKEQCESIKKVISGLIIETVLKSSLKDEGSSLESKKKAANLYLNKLNHVLVQILKYDSSLISDIVKSSYRSESLCQNNMIILKLFSEEVFDSSNEEMTRAKTKHLKTKLCDELNQILKLCNHVLKSSKNAKLVHVTLESLLTFLSWMPVWYIFSTKDNILETLCCTKDREFCTVPFFRNITWQCLTEIAGISTIDTDNCDQQIVKILFACTMRQLEKIWPEETIKDVYALGKEDDQNFILELSLFLSTILKVHGALIFEKAEKKDLLAALHYLLSISEVEVVEIFKICLEYWEFLTERLHKDNYMEVHSKQHLNLKFIDELKNVLSKLRLILIERMVKPDDVHEAKNEVGEIVMEYMEDTEHTAVYKSMQKTLTYLTRLDRADTEKIMTEKLNQFRSTEWSWKSFDSLCWAIGSISSSMPEEQEMSFLFSVIEHLFLLCKQTEVERSKSRIALSMTDILAQYPHFLKVHWIILKAVVDKLFDLMQVKHDDIQFMACDIFLKIAHRCFGSNYNRTTFATIPFGEPSLYIEKVVTTMPQIILNLKSDQQVRTFYEAVGFMIAADTNQSLQQSFIEKYMDLPNKLWIRILQAFQFQDKQDILPYLSHFLKTNVRACRALGHLYAPQLHRIYSDLLDMYVKISKNIIAALENDFENKNYIWWMRTVQKDILNLISESVRRSKPSSPPAMMLKHCFDSFDTVLSEYENVSPEVLSTMAVIITATTLSLGASEFISDLYSTVLNDYQYCAVPAAREPEVLSTMATVINHLGKHMTNELPKIFDSVFECTLRMINEDSEKFPEHRTHFYSLLGATVNSCFPGLLKLQESQFKLIMDSVFLAIKHPLRNISKQGLHILYQLFKNIRSEERDAQIFYETYFSIILQELLSVIADSSHSEDLPMQAYILAHMISIIKTNEFNPTAHLARKMPNEDYIFLSFETVFKLTHSTISDNLRSEAKVAIEQFFEHDQNFPVFLDHFKDFVIQIRNWTKQELAGEDS